ncbi:MAG: hypothetical protein ABF794_07935, partial [Acetobacter orientalis]
MTHACFFPPRRATSLPLRPIAPLMAGSVGMLLCFGVLPAQAAETAPNAAQAQYPHTPTTHPASSKMVLPDPHGPTPVATTHQHPGFWDNG